MPRYQVTVHPTTVQVETVLIDTATAEMACLLAGERRKSGYGWQPSISVIETLDVFPFEARQVSA